MSWRSDLALWFLASVPLFAGLIFAAAHFRKQATMRFGDQGIIRNLTIGADPTWRWIRAGVLLAGVAALVVALAGPRYGSRTRVLRKRGIDVVVALDFSKSMLAKDVSPNRIDRAKAELVRFFDELTGDRVGIVAFAGETMEFPMTVDYAAAGLFLRDLGPMDMPVGGTAIGRALVASKRLIERASQNEKAEDDQKPRSKVVILFTDGEDHEGDPQAAAEELKEAGIRLYTVGIGSRSGEPIPTMTSDGVSTGYLRDDQGTVVMTSLTAENENALTEMATSTGGKYFRARDGGVGVDAIRKEMRSMQQSERKARSVTVHEDRYALILLPAFLLIVLEALLPEAWIRRRRKNNLVEDDA